MTEEQEKELKNQIENLYFLIKKLTEKPKEIKVLNIPESPIAQKYIQEVDKQEKPQLYWHMQDQKHGIEIRKGKGNYYVKCIGWKPRSEKLLEESNIVNKVEMGTTTTYIYMETLEETIENYRRSIDEYYTIIHGIKENTLIF